MARVSQPRTEPIRTELDEIEGDKALQIGRIVSLLPGLSAEFLAALADELARQRAVRPPEPQPSLWPRLTMEPPV